MKSATLKKILHSGVLAAAFLLLAGCSGPGEIVPTGDLPVTASPAPLQTTSAPTLTQTTTATPHPSATPAPTHTPTEPPTLTPSPVPDWSRTGIVFDLAERSFGERTFLGVYLLLDVSPDYQRLLIAREGKLLSVNADGDDQKIIADDFLFTSPQGALWDSAGEHIYYVAVEDDSTRLIRVNAGGEERQKLPLKNPVRIYKLNPERIVWAQGTCDAFGGCSRQRVIWSTLSGEEIASWEEGKRQMLPCQTGSRAVYALEDQQQVLRFHIRKLGEEREKLYWLSGSEYPDCAWAPGGGQIALTAVERGGYSGTVQDYRQFLLDVDSGEYTLLPERLGSTTRAHWSPEGDYVVFTGTEIIQEKYQVTLKLMQTRSRIVQSLADNLELTSVNYLTVNHLDWLP